MTNYETTNIIQFDTIKIRTKIDYLKSCYITFNQNFNPNNGTVTGLFYSSKNDNNVPFDLFIAISYPKQSLTIEFSSKILFDNYPKLISKHTFKTCLDNIRNLGICDLNVEAILEDSYFSKLHVTKDISLELTDNILEALNSQVDNYRRFKWQHYDRSGIRFTKDVSSRDCKETIVIYNKEKEMTLSKNSKFLSLCQNSNNIIQYFQGKARFEIELDSMEKIRKYLNIANTHIKHVFATDNNPILFQFNRVFGVGESEYSSPLNTPDEYFLKHTILNHNYDLKQIEQDLRKCYASRSGLNKKMNQIKELCFQMQNTTSTTSNIFSNIREKLAA